MLYSRRQNCLTVIVNYKLIMLLDDNFYIILYYKIILLFSTVNLVNNIIEDRETRREDD